MKYLKNFENKNTFLEPYQMYEHKLSTIVSCYIGQHLFLNFYRGDHDIDFSEHEPTYKEFSPLDINVKDYIVKKNLVIKTINSINEKIFKNRERGLDNKLINYFKIYLLSDERIELLKNTNKYNL